jgi:hypothetical protein
MLEITATSSNYKVKRGTTTLGVIKKYEDGTKGYTPSVTLEMTAEDISQIDAFMAAL